MSHDDVMVEIRPISPKGFEARLVSQSQGLRTASVVAPWSGVELHKRLSRLEEKLLAFIHQNLSGTPPLDTLETDHREIGQTLFETLFVGEVGNVLERHYANAETAHGSHGLRIRLVFDPAHPELAPLAALPWELLFRAATDDFLGRHRRTLIVRYLENRRTIPKLAIDGPLRILLVESSPRGERTIDATLEITGIRRSLEALPRVTIHVNRNPSISKLRRRLIDGRYHVLHFMGHGAFQAESGEGALAFVDSEGGKEVATAPVLAENLKGIDSLRLVVLSSCSQGKMPRREDQGMNLNVAPALLMAGLPAVIAMQFPISEDAAALFSEKLYEALGKFDPVDVAVSEARLALFTEPGTRAEWPSVTIFSRVADGKILVSSNQEAAPLETPPSSGPAPDPGIPEGFQYFGIRTFNRGLSKELQSRDGSVLNLEDYFDPDSEYRLISDEGLWHTAILPRVRAFLADAEPGRPLFLEIAAHNSIAFLAGQVLDGKSGIDITIRQRGSMTRDWSPAEGEGEQGSLWIRRDDLWIDKGSRDVALAVGLTHDVSDDVYEYVRSSELSVRRILSVIPPSAPSPTSVRSGAHALRLAHQLTHIIRQRELEERKGMLHLFAAAPGIFMFLLGQQAKNFGAVQLYEHDLESGWPGAYLPSIRLIPPRWRSSR